MFSTHPLSAGWQGYGLLIMETLLILGLIAVAAWAVVRFGRHRFGAAGGERRMRVVERLPLEPRRSLYLVEVDGAALLLGAADGSVRLIKELDNCTVGTPAPPELER